MTGSIFRKNSAAGSGGAILTSGGHLVISSSKITDNEAATGGGIASVGGQVEVAACLMQGNRAADKGGALSITQGDVLLSNWTLLRGNMARGQKNQDGAAIILEQPGT